MNLFHLRQMFVFKGFCNVMFINSILRLQFLDISPMTVVLVPNSNIS